MSERHIKHDPSANLYAVIGTDDLIIECFDTLPQAKSYLSDYESAPPVTAGAVWDLAKKHNALFRHD